MTQTKQTVESILSEINRVTGLNLVSDSKKIIKRCGKKYFCVVAENQRYNSPIYMSLERYAWQYNTIKVHVGGANHITIEVL